MMRGRRQKGEGREEEEEEEERRSKGRQEGEGEEAAGTRHERGMHQHYLQSKIGARHIRANYGFIEIRVF